MQMANLHFPRAHISFPNISYTKVRSIDLFSFSILMFNSAKFGDLKPTIDEKQCP